MLYQLLANSSSNFKLGGAKKKELYRTMGKPTIQQISRLLVDIMSLGFPAGRGATL
jgi:hypothetical protein